MNFVRRLHHSYKFYTRPIGGKMGKHKGKGAEAVATTSTTAKKSDKEKPEEEAAISLNKNGEIMLRIHAKPNAKTTRVTGIGSNEIELAIAAPPRDGQANETLLSAMMEILGLRKNEITFDAGARSRSKILLVNSERISLEEVRQKLEENAAGN